MRYYALLQHAGHLVGTSSFSLSNLLLERDIKAGLLGDRRSSRSPRSPHLRATRARSAPSLRRGGAISTVPASASRRHQRHERLATTLPKQQPRRLEPPPDLGPFWVPFSPCPGSGDGTLGLPRTGIGRGSTGATGEHGGHGGHENGVEEN